MTVGKSPPRPALSSPILGILSQQVQLSPATLIRASQSIYHDWMRGHKGTGNAGPEVRGHPQLNAPGRLFQLPSHPNPFPPTSPLRTLKPQVGRRAGGETLPPTHVAFRMVRKGGPFLPVRPRFLWESRAVRRRAGPAPRARAGPGREPRPAQ